MIGRRQNLVEKKMKHDMGTGMICGLRVSCTRPIVVFGNCSVIHARAYTRLRDVNMMLPCYDLGFVPTYFGVPDMHLPGLT